MPTDKIRPVMCYPLTFRSIITQGIGEFLLLESPIKQDCKCTARKFRTFLRSIAAYPLHPLNEVLAICTVRTRLVQKGESEYQLFIAVNRKINWVSCQTPPEITP